MEATAAGSCRQRPAEQQLLPQSAGWRAGWGAGWGAPTYGKLWRGEGQLAQGKTQAGRQHQDGQEAPGDAGPIGERFLDVLGAEHQAGDEEDNHDVDGLHQVHVSQDLQQQRQQKWRQQNGWLAWRREFPTGRPVPEGLALAAVAVAVARPQGGRRALAVTDTTARPGAGAVSAMRVATRKHSGSQCLSTKALVACAARRAMARHCTTICALVWGTGETHRQLTPPPL